MNQKGSITLFVFLGLIIALGIASAAYYLGTKKASRPISSSTPIATPQTPQPSPTPFSTIAELKTYTNKTYGFSLQYPSRLTVSNEFPDQSGLSVEFSQQNFGFPRMTILIFTDKASIDQDQADLNTILSNKQLRGFNYSLLTSQNISGQPLYVFSEDWINTPGKLPPAGGPLDQLVAMGVINGNFYQINYLYEDYNKGSALVIIDQKQFTQILSTLKFSQ